MESLWIIAGVFIGYVVRDILSKVERLGRPGTRQVAQNPDEMEVQRLEHSERMEKLDRMIERYRKRAGTPQEPQGEVLERTPEGERDRLRRKAISLGLLKGGVSSVILGEGRESESHRDG